MLKTLVEKRSALIAEYEKIKNKVEDEKRSAYSNEEREQINKIKLDIEDLDAKIGDEKFIDEKRNAKLDTVVGAKGSELIKDKSLISEFRSYLESNRFGEKFTIPFYDFEKRATVTTTSNSQLKFTDQFEGLSVNDSDLVLSKLGVKTYYFDSGAVDFPSMSEIVGTFQGTVDTTVSDQSLTTNKKTLTPTFVTASIEVSKEFIKQSKQANIQNLMAELQFAVQKALEKRTIDSFSTVTAIVSGATGVTTTFHNAAVQMEAALNGVPSGYIFASAGYAKGKVSKKDAGSGEFAISNGMLNGYPVMRSTLQTNVNHAYLINASAVAMGIWGDGITIELISDATLGRKGNILILASCMADGSYLDANKIALIKNVNKLT
jgi:hypothetical protein